MQPILSIGITSYKRVNELIRCVKSVQTKYTNEIEILISEDCSPLSNEIRSAVEAIQKDSPYVIRFTTNEHNLGYDMNLGAIIRKCTGKYVFLMSDDDALYDGALDKIIPFLLHSDTNGGVMYAPFVYSSSNIKDRNHGPADFDIEKGEISASKYIYDSILFSGLIFRKEYVEGFDSSRFKNYNYFQVYMFLKMLYHYGGHYFAHPSVLCVGDGENAYGISESSGGNELLAHRESVKSILEFNKTLIKVIRIFDKEEDTHVFDSFEKQYSLHAYSPMSIARKCGRKYFKEYWTMLNSLDLRLYPITKVFYWMLLILGADISNFLTGGFRKILK